MKKVKTMVYITADTKKRVLELRETSHKSLSSLVDEGLEAVVLKYASKPKTLKDALKATYGASKTIEYVRDEFNKDFEKRAARRGE